MHMEKPAETTTHAPNEDTESVEDKHGFNWGWIGWPLVFLLGYALSYGPYEKYQERGYGNSRWYSQMSAKMYVPLGWLYRKTPLHKPLGLYYHLWLPKYFDAKGNEI
jgi:hypothetical protein